MRTWEPGRPGMQDSTVHIQVRIFDEPTTCSTKYAAVVIRYVSCPLFDTYT